MDVIIHNEISKLSYLIEELYILLRRPGMTLTDHI